MFHENLKSANCYFSEHGNLNCLSFWTPQEGVPRSAKKSVNNGDGKVIKGINIRSVCMSYEL